MGGIGVEEPAAVGADLLDGDLGRRRTYRQGLLGNHLAVGVLDGFDEGRLGIGAVRLHDALGHQDHRPEDRHRQQDVEHRSRHIDPEIADRLAVASGKAPDHRDQHGHARRRRDEILHGHAEHLRQIAHRGLAAVGLPVRVRDEAHGRVERRVGLDGGQVLRIQGQKMLDPLQHIEKDESGRIECQHRQGVPLPAYLPSRIDIAETVDQPFERPQHSVEADGLSLVHPCHVPSQRLDEGQQHDQIEYDLQQPKGVHQNFSGLSNAISRYTSRPAVVMPPRM